MTLAWILVPVFLGLSVLFSSLSGDREKAAMQRELDDFKGANLVLYENFRALQQRTLIYRQEAREKSELVDELEREIASLKGAVKPASEEEEDLEMAAPASDGKMRN